MIDGSTEPMCPHCNWVHDHWYESGGFELDLDDGQKWDMTCDSCDKPFGIIQNVYTEIRFTNYKQEKELTK